MSSFPAWTAPNVVVALVSRPRLASKGIQIVRPFLHHPLPFGEVRSTVITPPEWIYYGVSPLVLEKMRRHMQNFVQHRPISGAKPVTRHDVLLDSQASHSRKDGIVRHRASITTRPWEDEHPGAGHGMQRAEDRYGLRGQRHDVRRLCLRHKESPLGGVQIDVCPLGLSQFSRPDEHQWRETQRAGDNRRCLIAVEHAQEGRGRVVRESRGGDGVSAGWRASNRAFTS